MNTNDQVGRNEPCPCGSGKKFKLCCGGRQGLAREARRSPWTTAGLAVVGLAVVATAALQLVGEKPVAAAAPPARPAPTGAPLVAVNGSSGPIQMQHLGRGRVPPLPPGPAPAGKVWSAEHGHYHDAPGTAPNAAPGVVSLGNTAPIVPGAPQPASSPLVPKPQPDGPVPEGKVWSPEHGHWHDAHPAGAK